MALQKETYFCAYHSVAYFVFRKDSLGGVEPILEVGDMDEGNELAQWLGEHEFVGGMIAAASNDWH